LKSLCTKELDEEFFDFFQRKIEGQKVQKSEEKRSLITLSNFAEMLLGKLYVAKFFPPEAKQKCTAMIDQILSVMNDSITNSDWITEPTKNQALDKLKHFTVKLGHPDEWKDFSTLDVKAGDSLYEITKKHLSWDLQTDFYNRINNKVNKRRWPDSISPQKINAQYRQSYNDIIFPAAILQPPFFHLSANTIDFDMTEESDINNYDPTIPANFGGIGAVIAHEITHGFDDQGKKYDQQGNLREWWTEEDAALFKSKCDIMAELVSSYKYVDERDGKEYSMNSNLTMGENIADLGGVCLSFKGLMKQLSEDGVPAENQKNIGRIFLSPGLVFGEISISQIKKSKI